MHGIAGKLVLLMDKKTPRTRGTPQVQCVTSRAVSQISCCDVTGVLSHTGTVLLAGLADRIGLTALLSEATDGLRGRRAGHDRAGCSSMSRSPTAP